jgi:hypothetical protein
VADHAQIALTRGADAVLTVPCKQADGVTALDLTGATVMVWELIDDDTGEAALSKSLGAGVTAATPANGIASIAISASDSAGIAEGFYRDQLNVTVGGKVSRQSQGPIAVFS